MDIKYGLFSCDSHAQLDRDAWTKRLSKEKWGERIPQIVEVSENGQTVDRWIVNGKVRSEWVCNCPAAMEGGVQRGYYPRRWDEVPRIVLRSGRTIESFGRGPRRRRSAYIRIRRFQISVFFRPTPNSSWRACKRTMTPWRSGARRATVTFPLRSFPI